MAHVQEAAQNLELNEGSARAHYERGDSSEQLRLGNIFGDLGHSENNFLLIISG